VRVDELDAQEASDEQLLAIHRIEAACLPELVPGEPSRPAGEAIAYYRHPPATAARHHWVAGDAGVASVYIDSPSAVFLDLLVAPEHRRRGVGSALLETVCTFARARGLQTLIGQHATPGGAAFAARFGGVDGQRNVRGLLGLRSAELAAPEPPAGWRLEMWLGRVPDEYVESYARAREALDDAPTEAGVRYAAPSVERVRAMEESLRRRDRELRVTAALDDRDEVGAFTDLRVSRGSTLGFTDDTGTVAAHRGIGLATAVKLESLRRLRADRPEVTVVTTTNAEENAAMRHVNARLGFVAAATLTSTVVSL
jgi:mycothiol synthase